LQDFRAHHAETLQSLHTKINNNRTQKRDFIQFLTGDFSTKDRVIVYVWINDEFNLRKAGSKTDPYAVFKSMLNAGDPPRTLEALLKRAKELRLEAKGSKALPDIKD
jgi:hypothetical protein